MRLPGDTDRRDLLPPAALLQPGIGVACGRFGELRPHRGRLGRGLGGRLAPCGRGSAFIKRIHGNRLRDAVAKRQGMEVAAVARRQPSAAPLGTGHGGRRPCQRQAAPHGLPCGCFRPRTRRPRHPRPERSAARPRAGTARGCARRLARGVTVPGAPGVLGLGCGAFRRARPHARGGAAGRRGPGHARNAWRGPAAVPAWRGAGRNPGGARGGFPGPAGAARGQRKMSGYPLRPRTPQPTTRIDFSAAIRTAK